jgi:lipocalin/ligand-binding SRPBCC domain-containing protein
MDTGEALRDAGVPVVEFRASIILGAGSLSFEMIRALVERLPVMICPRWVDTRTQPIAIDDVLRYLSAARDLADGREGVFEIGGPEVVSYGEMMREYARRRQLRRLFLSVPVLTPRLSGLWLGLVTPAHARVGRALIEGLRNPTVVRSPAAREAFDIRPMSLGDAFRRAIDEHAGSHYKVDTRAVTVDVPPVDAFVPIRRIGGATGWYFGDALWRLRGWLDRWLGGPGMPRHRRDPDECVVGDIIDGWRVEAYEPDRLLRLTAGMKLPGRGWLEFRVEPADGGAHSVIRQTATFDPRGVAGRVYWYAVLPLHALIFRGLLRRIAEQAAPCPGSTHLSTFTYGSIVAAPAAEVFRWHEQPGALAALTPSGLVRIEQHEGGIRDGGRVTVSMGVDPMRVRWQLRHHGYIAGRRFCDEQVRGPFAVWRHTHLFEPIGPSQALYQDRIDFAVTRHRVLNHLAAAVLRPLLTFAFAHRHRIVRAAVDGRRRVRPRWAAAVVVAVAATLQPADARAQTPPVRTVPFVDLDRYAGDWFEIARFPNRFQRQCVGDVRASYALRADGRINVVNRCRTADGQTEARGVARLVDEQTHAKLKVRFAPAWLSWLPAVWGDYWIVGLAPDYSWAVVGDPDRQYLWILARTPRLEGGAIAAARTAARDNGFDVDHLVQTPQQIGRP